MDKIIFSGNVGREPTVETKDGREYCKFTVAVNRKVKGEKQTDWRNVTAFGKQVDFIKQYVTKGRSVIVEGRPSAHAYKNKLEELVASIDVVADSVELVGGNKQDGAEQAGAAPSAPAQPVAVDGEDELPF